MPFQIREWCRDWNAARKDDPRGMSYSAISFVISAFMTLVSAAVVEGNGQTLLLIAGIAGMIMSLLHGSHHHVQGHRHKRQINSAISQHDWALAAQAKD